MDLGFDDFAVRYTFGLQYHGLKNDLGDHGYGAGNRPRIK